jgi:hypothetical protein
MYAVFDPEIGNPQFYLNFRFKIIKMKRESSINGREGQTIGQPVADTDNIATWEELSHEKTWKSGTNFQQNLSIQNDSFPNFVIINEIK